MQLKNKLALCVIYLVTIVALANAGASSFALDKAVLSTENASGVSCSNGASNALNDGLCDTVIISADLAQEYTALTSFATSSKSNPSQTSSANQTTQNMRTLKDLIFNANASSIAEGESIILETEYQVSPSQMPGNWEIGIRDDNTGIAIDDNCTANDIFEVTQLNIDACQGCLDNGDGTITLPDKYNKIKKINWTLTACDGASQFSPVNLITYQSGGTNLSGTNFDDSALVNIHRLANTLGFILTLPGESPISGGSSAAMFFNASSNTFYDMDPCVLGTNYCQDIDNPFFVYQNTGDVNFTISLRLDQNLSGVFALSANTEYDPVGSNVISDSPLALAVNVIPNSTVSAWFFGDFIDAYPSNSTTRNLIANVSQTGGAQ